MRVIFDHEILAFGSYENQVGSWGLCTFYLVIAPRYFLNKSQLFKQKIKA